MVCSFIPKNIYWTKNHVFSLSSLIWWRIQTVYCLAISIVSFGRLRVEWKTFFSAFIMSQELKCQTFCPWSIDVFIFDILLYVLLANEIVSLEQISTVHFGSSLSSLKIKFHDFSTKQKFRENGFTKKLNCYVFIMIANIVVNSHICRRQHWWFTLIWQTFSDINQNSG